MNLLKKKNVIDEDVVQVDPAFVDKIAPTGGISFTPEDHVLTGSGYEMCVYVYEYPATVSRNWLASFTANNNTICVIDISSTNKADVKRNLRKSLEEQKSRAMTAKSSGDYIDAQKQYAELEEIYQEVKNFGTVMKVMLVRIYVPAKTLYEADVAKKEIIKALEGDGFKAAVSLNETKSDWRNAFLSYEQQQQGIYRRKGQEISSRAISGGHFFHFSSLDDPCGKYYGITPTGGSVFLDLFHLSKSRNRMSYNLALVGKMGVGKSTLLKKMLVDRAMRGDMVRVFDVTGEFTQLVEWLGGEVIRLDGQEDSIINVLQILPDENETLAYNKHMAKVMTVYQYLKKDIDENEKLILKQLLALLYVQFKICDKKGNIIRDLNTMQPNEFPILSDLLNMTRIIIDNFDAFEKRFRKEEELQGIIRSSMLKYVENIELKLVDLCTTYGNVFNGYTTIKNFYDQPIVCFNTSALASMEDEVYDAQLHNALSMCWDNAVVKGAIMKDLFEQKKIAWEDITRSLVLIDEAHHSINANKLAGVKEISRMMREGRKYFAGIGLASQYIGDFVPENASSEAAAEIKKLFTLTTYKFIMNHDSSSIPDLRKVFSATFTDDEIERITTIEGQNCILSAGKEKLEFEVYAEPIVLEIGGGGA